MPPRRRNPLSSSASYIFVDREDPKRTFWSAIADIPREGMSIRSWYGVGGQGKTALARELFRISAPDVAPDHAHLRRAMLDLHERPLTDPDRLLVWIRNAFAKAGVSFPAFDIAFCAMWEKTRGDEPLPNFVNPWLHRTGDAITELAPEALTMLPEVATDFLGSIPVLGYLLKKGSKWAVDKGKAKWIEQCRPYLQVLHNNGQPIEDYEISNQLPWLLAQDFNRHLERHPDDRFVLFVDEYERVMDRAGTGSRFRENRFDEHMRSVLTETNGLLALFFSRERLPWGEDPNWRDDLDGNQHILGGLSDKDAHEWLLRIPITDAAIRKAMIAGAKETDEGETPIYPLMLDLQVEHWRNLGADARPEDFSVEEEGAEARRLVLVKRLMRDYDDATQELLTRLSVSQNFDRVAFEHVATQFNIPVGFSHFEKLTELSIIEAREDGWLSPHRTIADAILKVESVAMISASQEDLQSHYLSRATSSKVEMFSQENMTCFLEAAYIRRKAGIPGYVKWLDAATKDFDIYGQDRFLEGVWRDALSCAENEKDLDNLDIAICLGNIAQNILIDGRHDEALTLSLKRLDLTKSALGSEHEEVAISLEMIGLAYMQKSLYEEALDWFRQCLEVRLRHPDRNDVRIAKSAFMLAKCLAELHRLEEAIECANQSLAIYDEIFGPESLRSSMCHAIISRIFRENGEFENAEHHGRTALATQREYLGERHLTVANTYDGIAYDLLKQGKFTESEEAFSTALGIKIELLGENNSSVATSEGHLAMLYAKQGRIGEAETLTKSSLRKTSVALGDQHPAVGEIYCSLARVISGQDREDEVESYYRLALERIGETKGDNSPVIANIHRDLSFAVLKQGRVQEASDLALESVRKLSSIDPYPAENIVTAMLAFGIELNKIDQAEGSEIYLQNALKISSNALGYRHPLTYSTLHYLSQFLEDEGRTDEAEGYRRQAVEVAPLVYGEDHIHFADALTYLASNLISQDRPDEAYGFLSQSEQLRGQLAIAKEAMH